jgi:hypothetical protein
METRKRLLKSASAIDILKRNMMYAKNDGIYIPPKVVERGIKRKEVV